MKLEMEKANGREKDLEIWDLKEKVVKLEMEKAYYREKDSEIRDLKENVVKLEMEKADYRFKFWAMHLPVNISSAFSVSNFPTFFFKSLISKSFSL